MKQRSVLLIGLVGFLLLYGLMLANKWRPIEQDIAMRTSAALAINGQRWATPTLVDRGRDVLLSGTPPDTEAREQAIAIAQSIYGVRVVDASGIPKAVAATADAAPVVPPDAPAAAPEPAQGPDPSVTVQAGESGLRVTAVVSSPGERDAVLQALAGLPIENDLAQAIQVGPSRAPLPLSGLQLAHALQRLSTVDSGQMQLTGEALSISGALSSRQAHTALLNELYAMTPPGFAVQSTLTSPADIVATPPAPEARTQAAASAAEPTIAGQCQQRFDKLLAANTIRFASGSAELDVSSIPLLHELADVVRACPYQRILIEGHTDNTGHPAFNQQLSAQRAGAVADYLVASGVPEQGLSHAGFGASQPVDSNATRDGRARNRRIEIRVQQ